MLSPNVVDCGIPYSYDAAMHMLVLCAQNVDDTILRNFLLCSSCYAAEAVLLGFQHYLVMLGTTVIIPTALVPQMGGNNVRFQT